MTDRDLAPSWAYRRGDGFGEECDTQTDLDQVEQGQGVGHLEGIVRLYLCAAKGAV
jgi:hypothetical protein